jgi:hypothetical protein
MVQCLDHPWNRFAAWSRGAKLPFGMNDLARLAIKRISQVTNRTLGMWRSNTLPIFCLFRAPTAVIFKHAKATPDNSQASGRKEVRLNTAIRIKITQQPAKGV